MRAARAMNLISGLFKHPDIDEVVATRKFMFDEAQIELTKLTSLRVFKIKNWQKSKGLR